MKRWLRDESFLFSNCLVCGFHRTLVSTTLNFRTSHKSPLVFHSLPKACVAVCVHGREKRDVHRKWWDYTRKRASVFLFMCEWSKRMDARERKRVTGVRFAFISAFVCARERERVWVIKAHVCEGFCKGWHLSLKQHHWGIVSTVDQDKTSRPEGSNAAEQQKSI